MLNSADSVGAARERIAQTGACGLLGETEISPPRCRDAISLMCNIHRHQYFPIDPLEINDFRRTALHLTLMCHGRDTKQTNIVRHFAPNCSMCIPCEKKREQLRKLLPHCASYRTSLIHVFPHAGEQTASQAGYATCVFLRPTWAITAPQEGRNTSGFRIVRRFAHR